MVKKTRMLIAVCILLLLMMTACGASSDSLATSQVQTQTAAAEGVLPESTVTENAVDALFSAVNTAVADAPGGIVAETVAEAVSKNSADHGNSEDYVWDGTAATQIVLAGDVITVEGEGVVVNGRSATITSAGSYSFSGSLTEGQIIVDTKDEGLVQLVLNGVEITNSTTAPIYIANAEETAVILAENSKNTVTDGAVYVFADPQEDEPNAAIFSKDNLTIYGSGSLTVAANYNDGITSKDGLIIAGGTITVNAADDGIRGKDYLIIKDGSLTVTAQSDGLKSDEDEDTTLGYITIENGTLNITSGGDAIQAATDVLISDGVFTLTSGGGSGSILNADTSAKGIKGAVSVLIDGGSFTINSADDALHSNDTIVINNGTFVITSGDDGIHADANLELNGGVIQIAESYEGIESAVITINDGEISVVSSDDGINVAAGSDGSGFGPGGGPPPGGAPGQDTFTAYTGDNYLYINGGYVVVDAAGDGIDANGAIEMTNGVVIVNGPTEQMNGSLDYDGTFTISGGFLTAAGSAGMAQTADVSSTQNALLLNFNDTLQAGTLIHIQDSSGTDVLTFAPSKAFQSLAFSSSALKTGETYTVFYNGSSSGTATDGLYEGGTYQPGTEYTRFTITDTVTRIGSTGRA